MHILLLHSPLLSYTLHKHSQLKHYISPIYKWHQYQMQDDAWQMRMKDGSPSTPQPPKITNKSRVKLLLTISWKIVAKGWACDSISNYQYNNIYITSQELFKWYIYITSLYLFKLHIYSCFPFHNTFQLYTNNIPIINQIYTKTQLSYQLDNITLITNSFIISHLNSLSQSC